MLRPLSFLDQHDYDTLHRIEEFGFGDLMLICPISKPKVEGRWMYLPKGEWYDFWTDKPMASGMEFWADTEIDEIPVFIRAGAVLPIFPLQQYVGEVENPQICLHVYYINGEQQSQLYLDAGDGYENENEGYSLSDFKVSGTEKTLSIEQRMEGTFKGFSNEFKIKLHAMPGEVLSIKSNDVAINFEKSQLNRKEVTVFKVNHDFEKITIEINHFDEEE